MDTIEAIIKHFSSFQNLQHLAFKFNKLLTIGFWKKPSDVFSLKKNQFREKIKSPFWDWLLTRRFMKKHPLIRILQQNIHLKRFLKTSIFFSKNPSIFSKTNTSFEHFGKFYYFSCILQKICYNLVLKIFTYRNVNEHRKRIWQILGKKRTIWVEDCLPIFLNMAQNIYYCLEVVPCWLVILQ